ncbi:MAG: heparinase II/III family protein [Gemmatimonadales bacterium]
MLTGEELEARQQLVEQAPVLTAMRDRLLAQARLVASRKPPIPALKGLLTADGGFCPADGALLTFDPWSPDRHQCPVCGAVQSGVRHAQRWSMNQHLWLAERMATAAAAGVMANDDAVLAWACEMVTVYGRRYSDYPNRDNVLGPGHLFSSTYLESIWLTQYLAAAFLLRESGVLDDVGIEAVNTATEEAVNLIGEFDEGLSNRQTWHNAALCAAGVWFEDEDLVQRALQPPRGLVGHLVDGFGEDGMWYEGENYHLFALRGLLVGADWARLAGVDLFEGEGGRNRLRDALRAPALSALPGGRFPARKDSRFNISLAQPMYLELWERGVALLLEYEAADVAADLTAWLTLLYQQPAPPAERFDSYLQEAGEPAPAQRTRSDLSWWMLCTMAPVLPPAPTPWAPGSILLAEQGLAILRTPSRYASLECGAYGGGHGHPDRLHLTLHADGVHWLPDPGTGSYVSRDLFWYRSTLAHNAPRLDGESQPMTDASCVAFEDRGDWSWMRGRCQGFTRTVVAGPDHLVDLLEFTGESEHAVELPWHLLGEIEVLSSGQWEAEAWSDEFVSGASRYVTTTADPIRCRATHDRRTLELLLLGGELVRAEGPGLPGETARRQFLLVRASGKYVRLTTVIAVGGGELKALRIAPGETTVETARGVVTHREVGDGWDVEVGGARVPLRGLRRTTASGALELVTIETTMRRAAVLSVTAPHLITAPPLDGTLAGFASHDMITLDTDDHYRRSEAHYAGAEVFSATASLGWDEAALYVAVQVRHSDPTFPPVDAPPLLLDNEPDLIHADGLQLYLQLAGDAPAGWIIVSDPSSDQLQVRAADGTRSDPSQVRGAWARTDDGYCITVALSVPGWPPSNLGEAPRFDLLVNEMQPGRQRRAGQLAWSGGAGWVYLRGDRHAPSRFGRIELA